MKNVVVLSLRSMSAEPDVPQVLDEHRSMLDTTSQSSPFNPGSPPNSYPVDRAQPSNSPPPPSVNKINLQFFRPLQTSQASSDEVRKVPPTPNALFPAQHPRALQPSSPRRTSPQDSYPTELYMPSRSFAPASQLPSPLSPGMMVKHLNVRKEERNQRQQCCYEEKRACARKSSRGLAFDVALTLSTMSPLAHTDSGLPLLPSHSSTSCPIRVLTSQRCARQDPQGLQVSQCDHLPHRCKHRSARRFTTR